jgi:hypothetical protein
MVMKKGPAGIISIAVVILLAIMALKVIGALIGFALKAVLLVLVLGAGVAAYLTVQKNLGGPRAP